MEERTPEVSVQPTQVQKKGCSPRTKWTYCLGGIGRDMAYSLYNAYLLTFILYTKQLTAAQFSAVSVIIIVCRIWDAFNDPIMGGIIENTHSKWGKFKPWILIGAITNAAVLVTIFSVQLSGWAFIIFFVFAYLIWDITYTMNDIGYWSMLPSLSSNEKERNSLSSFANLCAGAGSIISIGLVPVFTAGNLAIGGNSITAYMVVSIVIALCFIGCQSMTTLGVETVPTLDKKGEKVGLKRMLNVILKNDQLVWIAVVMLIYNTGSAIITGLGGTYIYFEFGYQGMFVTVFVAIFGAASAIVMAGYPLLSKRFSRKTLMIISLICVLTGYVMLFLSGAVFPANFYVLCAFGILVGLGQSIFYMVITINITNTVEYNEYKTGSRDEGIIFSMRPLMAKFGSALQQLVIMIVYLVLGVTTITNGISAAEEQESMGHITVAEKMAQIEAVIGGVEKSTRVGLLACMTFIPIVLIGTAWLIMRFKFNISEEKYQEILVEIANRKTNQNEDVTEDQQ